MTKTKNVFRLIALFLFVGTLATAQDAGAENPTGTAFPPKPKNMWELGVHGGYFQIAGDVNPDPGFGVGLHLRKSLGYVFSLRFNAMYGQAYGYNFQGATQGVHFNSSIGTNTGKGYYGDTNGDGIASNDDRAWFANHKTTYGEGSVQGVLSLGNLLFHKPRNKWDMFFIAGVGLNYAQVQYDALDGDDNPYEFTTLLQQEFGADWNDTDNRKQRKEIRKFIKNDILDGSWDTDGEEWGALFNLAGGSDDGDGVGARINPIVNVGLGVGYLINDRFSISLEHQATFNDDDLLDGYKWENSDGYDDPDASQNLDIPQYTHLRFNVHLGKKGKKVIPLWWLNPLEAPLSEIDKVKDGLEEVKGDEDKDGVLDIVDQEPDTPEDCPVDTRGVTLDSDGDGIPDCKDKEPYSPPGFAVDGEGVADVPADPYGIDPLKDKISALETKIGEGGSDWFLPMIHFDLDKYRIKPEFYPQLHHVATVLKKYPNVKVVAKGHTDVRMPNQYNQVLAYNRAKKAVDYLVANYGIDRSRLVLQYGGEGQPLIDGLPDNHSNTNYDKEKMQYMNRRVEFSIASGSDAGMSAPSGTCSPCNDTPRSSRPGKIYSGNPGAGY